MAATFLNVAEEFLNYSFIIFFQMITCVIILKQLFAAGSVNIVESYPRRAWGEQSLNFLLSFQRPVLIILDRNVDLCTPLHHTWTYQALCHDVLVSLFSPVRSFICSTIYSSVCSRGVVYGVCACVGVTPPKVCKKFQHSCKK